MTVFCKITPAQLVKEKFCSASEVARILGLDRSTVSRWQVCASLGGTGGRVPQKYWAQLIAAAKARKIKLTVQELSDC